MPVVGALAILLLAVGFVLISAWLLLVVLPPLLVVAAVLGALGGVVLVTVATTRVFRSATVLVSPAAYRAERIARRPAGPGRFDPDLAWAPYPLRQGRADVVALGDAVAGLCVRFGAPPFLFFFAGPFSSWRWWLLAWPVPLLALTPFVVLGVVSAALFVLITAVTLVVSASGAVVSVAVAAVLRGAEAGWRGLIRAEASCPHPDCYAMLARPAYRCQGCGVLHRDIRPGRLGVVFRRCRCGALMPTMVLRAAWTLEAVCQRCGRPLRKGSAALRDIRLPIFGDTSAGKTRLLYVGLHRLVAAANAAGIAVGHPDADSAAAAQRAFDVVSSGADPAKTSTGYLPAALTCTFGTGPGATLVHLYDAAGEQFSDADLHDSLAFLHHARSLVYVLDPFSVPAVRDRVGAAAADVAARAHAATGDPEVAYNDVVSRLRDSGIKAKTQRLAVVVSKSDLLGQWGVEVPDDSAGVAEWLESAGLHNLVLAARREFAEVRWFAVASVNREDLDGHDPARPLAWLAERSGLRVPVDPPAASTVESAS